MPIVRGRHRFDGHFTQIPNAWLRDYRLSYKARGLLAEVLSHAAGFRISRERLARLGKDGRDSITTAIAELEACGYLTREQTRLPNGQMGETIWTTKDPELAPLEDLPLAVEPKAAEPHLKNSELKNNETKNNTRLVAERFSKFWIHYPRKVGKGNAEKIFAKLLREAKDPEALALEIEQGAERMSKDYNLPPKQFIPHPATWLSREGWNDEPYPDRERTPEELAEIYRQKVARDKELRRIEAEREAIQAEADRKYREANPVTRCEHDRVLVMCPKCSPILGNKNKQ